MEEYKGNWMVGISGSNADAVFMHRVYGTKQQVKKHLMEIVLEDRKNTTADGFNDFDFGTEGMNSIQEDSSGGLYAFNCYDDHHNDFQAIPEPEIIRL